MTSQQQCTDALQCEASHIDSCKNIQVFWVLSQADKEIRQQIWKRQENSGRTQVEQKEAKATKQSYSRFFGLGLNQDTKELVSRWSVLCLRMMQKQSQRLLIAVPTLFGWHGMSSGNYLHHRPHRPLLAEWT